jgi:hypothetical protein
MDFEFETTSAPITSTAGLAFVGDRLEDSKFDHHLASLCPHRREVGRISDGDIARSMIGLICVGKPDFDAIGEFNGDPFFPRALAIERLPSAPILRQRIQGMPDLAGKAFRDLNVRLLAGKDAMLTETLHGTSYSVVHVDVSPMDNSGSHKEGVSCTYKQFDGYSPIMAYIGPHGFTLNNQLREGSSHCNCEGTKDWLQQTLGVAQAVAPEDIPRLVVTDAGHDAAENLLLFSQTKKTDFLVKRNLRRSDPADWLAEAKRQTDEPARDGHGNRRWYGQKVQSVRYEGASCELRTVWRATKKVADSDGQRLLEPEIIIEAYWTSLDWKPSDIQAFYEQRGTSEQYHSELKTDLALERLPSGKFNVNQHVMNMGMIAYNILRLLGQQMLDGGKVPGRKAESRRLRLRTVMQSLIYMAARIVHHARRRILKIFDGHGWAQAAMSLARGDPG